jgi:hypothetical protein
MPSTKRSINAIDPATKRATLGAAEDLSALAASARLAAAAAAATAVDKA